MADFYIRAWCEDLLLERMHRFLQLSQRVDHLLLHARIQGEVLEQLPPGFLVERLEEIVLEYVELKALYGHMHARGVTCSLRKLQLSILRSVSPPSVSSKISAIRFNYYSCARTYKQNEKVRLN